MTGPRWVAGTKFNLISARSNTGRMILDVAYVKSNEAAVAIESLRSLKPYCPGAQACVWDMALRGVHLQIILRELGWLPVVRVADKTHTKVRGKSVAYQDKFVHVENQTVTGSDGLARTVEIYAKAGAIGLAELDETGGQHFVPLKPGTIRRRVDKCGFRWYREYVLPETYGGSVVTVRLHGDANDEKRGFNRAENVRAIPAGTPDFNRLHVLRSDAESINRGLEDTLFLNRAGSLGWRRQRLELLGYALLVNSLTLARHRAREPVPIAA